MLIQPGKPRQDKAQTKKVEVIDLTKSVATIENDGKTLVWSKVAQPRTLTAPQIEIVCREMKWKNYNSIKTEMVRSRMGFKTCAQIVAELSMIDGYGERTVKGLHAALSKAGVGAK